MSVDGGGQDTTLFSKALLSGSGEQLSEEVRRKDSIHGTVIIKVMTAALPTLAT